MKKRTKVLRLGGNEVPYLTGKGTACHLNVNPRRSI